MTVVAEPLIVRVDVSKMVGGAKTVCTRVDPGTVTKKDDTTVTGSAAVAVCKVVSAKEPEDE